MSGTRNVGGKTSGALYSAGNVTFPDVVDEASFRVETPNGIARGTVTASAGYGNRKQVDWPAKGKANRSGE